MAGLVTSGVLILAFVAPAGGSPPGLQWDAGAAWGASSSHAAARAAALQADGKLVVAGWSEVAGLSRFALARYTRSGSLDASFGRGGRVLTGFGSTDGARAVVIQRDGRIVAAGSGSTSTRRGFALARYRANGSLDPTFGSGGKTITSLGGPSEVWALALEADGKLVAAGWTGDQVRGYRSTLVRYTRNGRLDAGFGRAGKAQAAGRIRAIAIQPDGEIVVAYWPGSTGRFAVARYRTDGSPDPSFGRGGVATTKISYWSAANTVAIQADGRIVLAGSAEEHVGDVFALARYRADGSLDTTFGADGTVVTDLGYSTVWALALQPDGKIVAAGAGDLLHHLCTATIACADFALARYTVDGELDPGFGRAGTVLTTFSSGSRSWDARVAAIAVQPDGKIVTVGRRGTEPEDTGVDFALARYDPQGRLDRSFGRGGKVTTIFGSP